MQYSIVPAILEKDFRGVQERVNQLRDVTDVFHLDVLDGKFAPNRSFGDPSVLASFETGAEFEIHLMASEPSIDKWIFDRPLRMILHHESFSDKGNLHRNIDRLLGEQVNVGLAVNPETTVGDFKDYLHIIDFVLIMTVHPGFTGQKFLPEAFSKVEYVRQHYPMTDIEVDGGINETTLPLAVKAGANRFVAHSAIYGSDDPVSAFERLSELLTSLR